MNREEKIRELVEREDDAVRRPALDIIDDEARRTNTFGSREHRAARERVESQHDAARRAFEGYSEAQLDAALGALGKGGPTTAPRPRPARGGGRNCGLRPPPHGSVRRGSGGLPRASPGVPERRSLPVAVRTEAVAGGCRGRSSRWNDPRPCRSRFHGGDGKGEGRRGDCRCLAACGPGGWPGVPGARWAAAGAGQRQAVGEVDNRT